MLWIVIAIVFILLVVAVGAGLFFMMKPPSMFTDVLLDMYADDFLNVYHVPVDDQSHKIPCKTIRILSNSNPNDKDSFIHLAEIQVWCDGKNIASEGTIVQANTYDAKTAAINAIDNNLDTYNHTQTPSWLELKFPSERMVDKIVFYNRRDCNVCFQRIKNCSMVIFNGADKIVENMTLLPLFKNNYVATYTKMKLLGSNEGWDKEFKLTIPLLKVGDQLIFSVTNGVSVSGLLGSLTLNKKVVPLTTQNLTCPTGVLVPYKYPKTINGVPSGVTIATIKDWITYDLIYKV